MLSGRPSRTVPALTLARSSPERDWLAGRLQSIEMSGRDTGLCCGAHRGRQL